MFFKDSAGQYQFKLPFGWVYNAEQSSLITVIFDNWDRSNEVISIRAMPSFAPPDASVDQWYEALEKSYFPAHMLPFTRMKCGKMPAALAEDHKTGPETIYRQILIKRGIQIDVVIQNRSKEPPSNSQLSEVLSSICRSLEVPTNWYFTRPTEQENIEKYILNYEEALGRNEWEEGTDFADLARKASQDNYLYSVIKNKPFPDFFAFLSLIKVLIYMAAARGGAGTSFLPLRDAEHLALRALHTLDKVPFLETNYRSDVHDILTDSLDLIKSMNIQLIQDEPWIIMSANRIEPLLEKAMEFYKKGDHETALSICEYVIADIYEVLKIVKEISVSEIQVPPELKQKLVSAGAHNPAEQAQLARQIILQYFSINMLTKAFIFLSELRRLSGDMVGATETSEALIAIIRKQDITNEATIRYLAYALIEHAQNLKIIEDEPSLEEASTALDEAEGLLDSIGEEGALRAGLCHIRASIMHSLQVKDNAIEIIDRGLQAAATEPEKTQGTIKALKSIKSQFFMILGRLHDARELAQEVTKLPDINNANEHRKDYLNLAIIDIKLNNDQEATRSFQKALNESLMISPFDDETLAILMVASRFYAERDFNLSYLLNLAAAANLDARRAIIPSDKFRIGFDESKRRREVYEDLVGRLMAISAGKEAVAAADRSRARSLKELLAAPVMNIVPPVPSQNPPSLEGDDIEQSLWKGAEYIIQSVDEMLKTDLPLHADEVEALAQKLGTQVLIIQPVNRQVALMLVHSSGKVETHFSSYDLDELIDYVNMVQDQLHIIPTSRGENGYSGSSSNDEYLYEAITNIWKALIGPLKDSLTVGEPLIIVPYREFSLVPFALLHNSQGIPLVEQHAISVVPSLAILRFLSQREHWALSCPGKAYIIGDPAFDTAKYLGGRLDGARDEAKAVKDILIRAGVSDENIYIRLDKEAHEESYRREARDCDLIHLACHAKVNDPAYTSCLYLAPHDHYDGLLLASEISNVKLNDALVFLGACDTGQGRASADGVIGLGRAFLEAGARAVIMSLWKVNDAAAFTLSSHFYRALLDHKNPVNVAEALRSAMLATRADLEANNILGKDNKPLANDPKYWSAFIVLGDSHSIHYKGDH